MMSTLERPRGLACVPARVVFFGTTLVLAGSLVPVACGQSNAAIVIPLHAGDQHRAVEEEFGWHRMEERLKGVYAELGE